MAMLHLHQVRAAPRELTQEELVKHVELSNKFVRRAAKGMGNNEDMQNDEPSLAGTNNTAKIHTIREIVLPKQSSLSLLDAAIGAKVAAVDLMERMGKTEQIESMNADILSMLLKKAEVAMTEFENSRSLQS